MKRLLLLSLLGLGFSYESLAQNANVSIANLGENSYYSSFNANTKTISGINFAVLSDGTNSTNTIPDFKVKIYLLPCDSEGKANSNTPVYIKTYTVSGFHQLSRKDYTNESINLSQVPNLSEGTYRLGIFVDAEDNIPAAVDDTDDNATLITLNGEGDPVQSIITVSASAKSDLQVGDIAFTFENRVIHFTKFVIKNDGEAPAPSFEVDIFVGNDEGNVGDVITIPSLDPGEEYTELPEDIDLDAREVPEEIELRMEVTVDHLSAVSESDENNNFKLVAEDVSKGASVTGISSAGELNSALNIYQDFIQINTEGGTVKMALFDLQGKQVRNFLDQAVPKGKYAITADFANLPDGTYVCNLVTNNRTVSKVITIQR